jgi:F0F1-type ATP synthase assembly protein I
MRKVLVSLLMIQTIVTLAVAGGFFAYTRLGMAVAALYGGAIGLVVSVLLAWRMDRASRPGAGVAGLFLGALERMVFVIAAFAVGLAVMKLAPLALIAGFIGAEFAYYIAAGLFRRHA